MKRSAIPTDYICLRAFTNSEWDNCQYALIHLTNDYRAALLRRLSFLALIEDATLSSLSFWDETVVFYSSFNDLQPYDLFTDDEDWVYVQLATGELDKFSQPESTLDTFQLNITRSGPVYYSANGKYTGEEFWTASIDLPFVLSPSST